jgi:outer membrane receptor for monomeric catechols
MGGWSKAGGGCTFLMGLGSIPSGVTLGGGYRYLGGTIIGENFSDGSEIKGPSQSYFDLLLKYTHRLQSGNRIDFQLNVYNLFDRMDPLPVRYVSIGDPTLPLSRARLIDPRSARFTVTYSF